MERLNTALTAQNKTDAGFRGFFGNLDKTKSKAKGAGMALRTMAAGMNVMRRAQQQALRLFHSVNSAIAEFGELGDRAATAGISTDFFQSLSFAAQEYGVAQSIVNTSLVAFVKRVGELKAGSGPLLANLKKINPVLAAQLKLTTSQQQALHLMANAIQDADSATEKAALANAAFSRTGIDMVRVLADGSQGLKDFAVKAERLGLIIDKNLIERAGEIGTEFETATRVLNIQFKQVLIELAPLISDLAKGALQLVNVVKDLYGVIAGNNIERLTGQYAALNKQIRNLQSDIAGGGNALDTLIHGDQGQRLAKLKAQRAEIELLISAARRIEAIPEQPRTAFKSQTIVVPPEKTKAATKALTVYNATLADTQATAAKTENVMHSLATTFAGQLKSNILAVAEGTKSLKQAFADMARSMLSNVVNMMANRAMAALLGNLLGAAGGGGRPAFSSIGNPNFAGLFAQGGHIPRGKVGIVGERGPELAAGPQTISPFMQGGGNVYIEIVTPPGASVDRQEHRDARGDRRLRLVFRDMMRNEQPALLEEMVPQQFPIQNRRTLR